MQKLLSTLKNEFFEVVFPTIFFFVAFNVITYTKKLMLEQYGIEFSGFVTAAIGALVVAKVVLIADRIPLINKYPDKPLIYNVAWKTIIYILVTFVVRFLEFLLPLSWRHQSLSLAMDHLWNEIIWPHFWAIQIWLFCLFFVYVSFRELARTLGEERFLQIFFGIRRSVTQSQPE